MNVTNPSLLFYSLEGRKERIQIQDWRRHHLSQSLDQYCRNYYADDGNDDDDDDDDVNYNL